MSGSKNQAQSVPSDAPPSYDTVVGSSSTSSKPKDNHLQVPGGRNAIPTAHRRSMEDEHRPLPTGWVRQFDTREQHHFYVDTKADPPRSIWHHPYDDDDYLSTLNSEQREQIQESERDRLDRFDYTDDESASTDKKSSSKPIASQTTGSSFPEELPPRTGSSSHPQKKLGFAEKLKQKATGMSKEERDQARANQAKQEQEYYEAHQKFRQCVYQAQVTGQPQWFARDPQGRDVYVEPPQAMYSGYTRPGAIGYNPYSSGPYSNPNTRFIRPQAPYGRPYGSGYGGGYGMPLAAGALGGLFLGGLLF